MRLRDLPQLLKEAASAWVDDGAMRLSAALAYYAVFSLAPLLVIVIWIAGLLFGQDAARGQIAMQISALAGESAALAIQSAIKASAEQKNTGLFASSVGLVVLLFGASTVFGELKDALNTIWGVTLKPGRAFLTLVRSRFISFSMVLSIGFLLLVSLVLSAILASVGKYMNALLAFPPSLWYACDFAVSFTVISALFAMIFKILPNVRIGWHDVWIGSAGTAFLFSLGKLLIGLYLGTSSIGSSFGAAGSVVVVLTWVYYSSCILFFGAEFTKAYVCKFGSGIVPDKTAILTRDVLRAQLNAFNG
jgi:membrane protein